MIAKANSACLHGIEARHVIVEVDISRGLPGWHMVGLPETVVKESKDRVTAAVRNCGYQLRSKKTTINLAPARHKKSGTYFDLPIALGLLSAGRLISKPIPRGMLFVGELALGGEIHAVPGVLSIALLARKRGWQLALPADNAAEVSVVDGLEWMAFEKLSDVIAFIAEGKRPPPPPPAVVHGLEDYSVDLREIRGQGIGRRALEIAAAGGHHCLFIGAPGTGKTMLAQRLPTILPPLTREEMVETTQIYSVFNRLEGRFLMAVRPFRAPHHGASVAGIIGGGATIQAGEITLAHNGVLFLDELGEFHRDVIDVLRQPIEQGSITITRAMQRARFPARFMLVAATNPCRCGYLGHPTISCVCTMGQIQQYRNKLSGPMLDRIDLQIELGPMTSAEIAGTGCGESSAAVRARVMAARERQARRYGGGPIANGQLGVRQLREFCEPTSEGRAILILAIERYALSARAYDRVLRVARTIADLAGEELVAAPHIAEAIQYRRLDRAL